MTTKRPAFSEVPAATKDWRDHPAGTPLRACADVGGMDRFVVAFRHLRMQGSKPCSLHPNSAASRGHVQLHETCTAESQDSAGRHRDALLQLLDEGASQVAGYRRK